MLEGIFKYVRGQLIWPQYSVLDCIPQCASRVFRVAFEIDCKNMWKVNIFLKWKNIITLRARGFGRVTIYERNHCHHQIFVFVFVCQQIIVSHSDFMLIVQTKQ